MSEFNCEKKDHCYSEELSLHERKMGKAKLSVRIRGFFSKKKVVSGHILHNFQKIAHDMERQKTEKFIWNSTQLDARHPISLINEIASLN